MFSVKLEDAKPLRGLFEEIGSESSEVPLTEALALGYEYVFNGSAGSKPEAGGSTASARATGPQPPTPHAGIVRVRVGAE